MAGLRDRQGTSQRCDRVATRHTEVPTRYTGLKLSRREGGEAMTRSLGRRAWPQAPPLHLRARRLRVDAARRPDPGPQQRHHRGVPAPARRGPGQPARRAAGPRPRLRHRAGVGGRGAHPGRADFRWQTLEAVPPGLHRARQRAAWCWPRRCRNWSTRRGVSRRRSSWSPTASRRRAAESRSPRDSRSCSTRDGAKRPSGWRWASAATPTCTRCGASSATRTCPLLRADNPEQLVEYIVWASKAASRVASRPVLGDAGVAGVTEAAESGG